MSARNAVYEAASAAFALALVLMYWALLLAAVKAPPVHAQAPTIEMRASVLNVFANLPDDWAGAGTYGIKQPTIDAAARALPTLGPQWWPIPATDGSIMFINAAECGTLVAVKPR